MRTFFGRYVALAVLLIALGPAARAAALEVAPVSHDLAPGVSALSMTVSNRGAAAVHLQLRGYAWRQDGGEDRLLPADEVIVAPAIFSLAPGQSQTVRALIRGAASDRERSYRLLLDELPGDEPDSHVRMALRLSIPVFLAAGPARPAQLEWQFDAARRVLSVANLGAARERVRELSLRGSDGQRLALLGGATPYVLAGAQRHWSVPAALPPGARLNLSAQTDAGPIEVPLVVAP